jgi:Predicted transcriptional regulator
MNQLAERISDSELEVMRVLWEAQEALPITAIRAALVERSGWEDSTIRTLVRRLHDKGVIKQEKRDMYYYSPCVSNAEYNEYSTRQLIDRLYKGSAKNLIAAIASHEEFSDAELEDLRKMLKAGKKDE